MSKNGWSKSFCTDDCLSNKKVYPGSLELKDLPSHGSYLLGSWRVMLQVLCTVTWYRCPLQKHRLKASRVLLQRQG